MISMFHPEVNNSTFIYIYYVPYEYFIYLNHLESFLHSAHTP